MAWLPSDSAASVRAHSGLSGTCLSPQGVDGLPPDGGYLRHVGWTALAGLARAVALAPAHVRGLGKRLDLAGRQDPRQHRAADAQGPAVETQCIGRGRRGLYGQVQPRRT